MERLYNMHFNCTDVFEKYETTRHVKLISDTIIVLHTQRYLYIYSQTQRVEAVHPLVFTNTVHIIYNVRLTDICSIYNR